MRRGFSLLEVMIALAVLAVALTGTVAGLLHAATELREGELLQSKRALLDAAVQRLLLSDKASAVITRAQARPATSPRALGIGAAPWGVDASTAVPGDLGTGAYFRILPTGEVSHVPDIPEGTPCGDAALPDGTYCREVLVTRGAPHAAAMTQLPSGVEAYTLWLRLSRRGEPAARAVVHTEVVIP